eukprot:c11417_g1_i1.p3 GENE.c11417_g1_i1~~c11417_g1_i1.p3  ORF type:complete len:113 (-),score=18.52 c11417_g1_i1:1189-1527(-)
MFNCPNAKQSRTEPLSNGNQMGVGAAASKFRVSKTSLGEYWAKLKPNLQNKTEEEMGEQIKMWTLPRMGSAFHQRKIFLPDEMEIFAEMLRFALLRLWPESETDYRFSVHKT